MIPQPTSWSSPAESKPLALTLFGPPCVSYQGRPLHITRRQPRALLYRLGAELKPISRDELVALFWPETDDATARHNLARLLCLIRDDLPAPKALCASTTAIGLDPEQVWSDTNVFAQLIRLETVSAWKQLSELYCGPFLSGFLLHENVEYELWQTTKVEQMRLRCLDALDKLIDHYTVCGEYRSAVAYARRYLALDNLAENVHCQLIRLYGRLGERDLVQRQFEECVLVLERELGVEPLPATRAAYVASLQNSSVSYTVRLPASVPHVVSDLDLPLLSRDEALQKLEKAYTQLKTGGIILISGEAGVGKSRLMHAFTAAQNALVLCGHCYNGTQQFAFHPIVEALRPAFYNPMFSELAISPVWLAAAERILPELCTIFPDLLASTDAESAQPQPRLFEALVQILAKLASKIDVLLCLDDLNWADESTMKWLHYAATRLHGSHVCIVATYCSQDGDAIASLRHTLQRIGLMAEIEVEPLSVHAVAQLLRASQRLAPNVDDETAVTIAGDIHFVTGGNTFFVLELILMLSANGGLVTLPKRFTKCPPMPQTVQATIIRRVEQVSPVTRQVLEAAAVLDPHLDFQLIRQTSGRDESEVDDGLSELVRQRILRNTPEGLAFQHPLVQQTIDEGLPTWRRRLLRHRAAQAMFCQRHSIHKWLQPPVDSLWTGAM